MVNHALADGLTEPDALDIIYTLMSPEVHHILAVERHWSADHYEQWLARTLAAALLPPAPDDQHRPRSGPGQRHHHHYEPEIGTSA
jgi:hypothetical protein